MQPSRFSTIDAQSLERIKAAYNLSKTSSIVLFQTLLDISKESGWDQTLAALEQFVIERRLSWWNKYKADFVSSGNACQDAYQIFYETYLEASIPRDGEIICASENRLVMRWWNPCPTLDACQHFELDTCEVCKKVYERPVQALFTAIYPGLKFDRNYCALRPHMPYCEEIIEFEG